MIKHLFALECTWSKNSDINGPDSWHALDQLIVFHDNGNKDHDVNCAFTKSLTTEFNHKCQDVAHMYRMVQTFTIKSYSTCGIANGNGNILFNKNDFQNSIFCYIGFILRTVMAMRQKSANVAHMSQKYEIWLWKMSPDLTRRHMVG